MPTMHVGEAGSFELSARRVDLYLRRPAGCYMLRRYWPPTA